MPKLTKTICCKLAPSDVERVAMLETVHLFSNACNYISGVAYEHRGMSNKVALHHLVYYTTREKFGLPAQLACTARDKVAESYKNRKGKQHAPRRFGPNTAVRLDGRTFSITKDGRASISTVKGRIKVPMVLGEFQRSILDKWSVNGAANLVYNKQTKVFYVHIVVKKEVDPPTKAGKKIGIDIGMVNLAVTSNGLRFKGKQAMHIRKHYRKLRTSLQAKGSRGSHRLAKRLQGKETRIMRDLNHCISRTIIDSLQTGDSIVMEELTHIRENARQRRAQRADFHSWPFAQLQSFIEYKAAGAGIAIEYINPAYTSQTCSCCGALGSRVQHLFSCSVCGHRNNADYNASYNIAKASLALNDGPQSIGPKATPSLAVASPVPEGRGS